jgi:protein-disulfide isomerase
MNTLPYSQHRLTVALTAAAAIAAFLIAANQISARTANDAATAPPPAANTDGTTSAAAYADSLLGGIPQHGSALGAPDAPVTLVEYADLQCPYCGQWARATLPTIVERYVRTGKLRIVFNGMAFVGPDSITALRTALAAGTHNHLWDVVDGLYVRQGVENSGWVTDDLVRELTAGIPGIDADNLLAKRWDTSIAQKIDKAAAAAHSAGVTSTPSFQIGPTGGKLERIEVTALDPGGITPAIEKALAR